VCYRFACDITLQLCTVDRNRTWSFQGHRGRGFSLRCHVLTSSGAHPASYPVCIGVSSPGGILCLTSLNIMKWMYRSTHSLDTRWRLVFSFTLQPVHPPGKNPQCPLNNKLEWSTEVVLTRWWREKNSLSLPSREPNPGHPVRSIVTILTELPRLTDLTFNSAYLKII
jgi:hypothetical protein